MIFPIYYFFQDSPQSIFAFPRLIQLARKKWQSWKNTYCDPITAQHTWRQSRYPEVVGSTFIRCTVSAAMGKPLTHTPASITKQYKLVLTVEGHWSSKARKVTVGLASHWSCITDCVAYQQTRDRESMVLWATEHPIYLLPLLRITVLKLWIYGD